MRIYCLPCSHGGFHACAGHGEPHVQNVHSNGDADMTARHMRSKHLQTVSVSRATSNVPVYLTKGNKSQIYTGICRPFPLFCLQPNASVGAVSSPKIHLTQ